MDGLDRVDIDTGAVILSPEVLCDLYQLVDSEEKYARYVNEKAGLSFYADFLYPMASLSTREEFYREKPEGERSEELFACRAALWGALSPYRMKLIRLSPASFVHFGTTRELLRLMADEIGEYRCLGWSVSIHSNLFPDDYTVSNSYVSRSVSVGAGSYIEDSCVCQGAKTGRGCVISGVTLHGETVPDGTVLHGLKLKDGRYVCRMYGIEDNPKETLLFGRDIGETLWSAKLYPVCDTMEEAVQRTLSLFRGFSKKADDHSTGRQKPERTDELISLRESFARADVKAVRFWQEKLRDLVAEKMILEKIADGVPLMTALPEKADVKALLERAAASDLAGADGIENEKGKESRESDESAALDAFGRRMRIYWCLWKMTGQDGYGDKCFDTIRDAVLSCGEDIQKACGRLVRDVTVRLPVRVNWGGGWSDTPPYCMEHGGAVLNAAVSINGRMPVEVTVRRLEQPVIALASTDMGAYREFNNPAELLECRNPSDPFALHKAALMICGVVPMARTGGTPDDRRSGMDSGKCTVADICGRLGGGIYMNTSVAGIPKGSGLGVSSILAAGCVKALAESMAENISDEEVMSRVLCMEQLMSTGGGWQDQAGGMMPGIKLITTAPGLTQKLRVEPVNVGGAVMAELSERFALIYTGQRRLARNLLRDVVSTYLSNDPTSLEAHQAIRQLAVQMRGALECGDVNAFARLLTEHWGESRRIDADSTNSGIEMIFSSIEDLIDGRMICGAGGGGFLQVILKKGVSKQELHMRLRETFRDSAVDVWESAFV